MFELQILFGNVIAPAAFMIVGWIVVRFLPLEARARFSPTVMALISGAAIWAAIAIRNGFAWWPEDAWQQVPIAALIVAFVAVTGELLRGRIESRTSMQSDSSVETQRSSTTAVIQWTAVALAAAFGAWLTFPSGETWAELQSQRNQWCLVIALASSLAWWGIAGCKEPVAVTIGFATIPLLIASAFLTSLSIMKVTEPLIAVATVLGIASLFDWRSKVRKSLPVVFAPALFAMSGFIAHASFQSYLGLPRTLYFLAMLSPAIVALAARTSQRKSTRVAIALTICVALTLAAIISVWTYIAGEVGAEPEW